MSLRIYFDALKNKIRAMFSKKLAFSATVFNSAVSKKAAIKQRTRFYNGKIDKYSYVGRNCLIQNTSIGKYVSISDNCNIGMPAHPIDHVSTSPVFLSGKNLLRKNFAEHKFDAYQKTEIGNDIWIGSNVLIKAGITVGDGAIIGAGAIVTHDVPPYEIWAGNPARFIKKRFDDATIAKLLESKWWDLEDNKIKEYSELFDSPQKFLDEFKI
ncbi:MAG: CatB-related O-acetyltransferase [Clostridia bacterium]|nr:CatB-related O-acetyltransferase [Clostridia bacterium]